MCELKPSGDTILVRDGDYRENATDLADWLGKVARDATDRQGVVDSPVTRNAMNPMNLATAANAAESAWLEREVAMSARLTDVERVAILLDLAAAIELIRANKTPAELTREEEVRRALDEPGRQRYRELAERLACR